MLSRGPRHLRAGLPRSRQKRPEKPRSVTAT